MQEQRHQPKGTASRWARASLLIAAALGVVLACPPARAQPADAELQSETAAASVTSPLGSLEYTAGRGLRVGHTGLTLGGYGNVNLTRDEGGPARLAFDDLSLFVIADPNPRVHLFSETEFEDLLRVDDHGRGGTVDNRFLVERLYGDVSLTDELHVRVGKFLTPVGRWNVIHAQPLVWTTSRPLVTELPFDNHVTGAMLFGSFFPTAGELNYSLYGQFVNQFERVPQPQAADRSGGARVEYVTPSGLSVGSSYQAFARDNLWQHLIGLDTLWQRAPLEVMGEFVYEEAQRDLAAQWGLYLQSVLEVVPRFYLVGRYEHFDERAPQPEVNLVVLGVAYKPTPPIILKAEYLFADHVAQESPPGLKCSFAILF